MLTLDDIRFHTRHDEANRFAHIEASVYFRAQQDVSLRELINARDPQSLTDHVRNELARYIFNRFYGEIGAELDQLEQRMLVALHEAPYPPSTAIATIREQINRVRMMINSANARRPNEDADHLRILADEIEAYGHADLAVPLREIANR